MIINKLNGLLLKVQPQLNIGKRKVLSWKGAVEKYVDILKKILGSFLSIYVFKKNILGIET